MMNARSDLKTKINRLAHERAKVRYVAERVKLLAWSRERRHRGGTTGELISEVDGMLRDEMLAQIVAKRGNPT